VIVWRRLPAKHLAPADVGDQSELHKTQRTLPEELRGYRPAARTRESSMIRSASARLPKPRVSVFASSRSL
jgi:hypothetical protein